MIDLENLEFEYIDKEKKEREIVDFLGLSDLFNNFLEYDLETNTIILSTEDIDSYSLKITEETTYEDVQYFIEEVLVEEGISDIIKIKVINK